MSEQVQGQNVQQSTLTDPSSGEQAVASIEKQQAEEDITADEWAASDKAIEEKLDSDRLKAVARTYKLVSRS